MILFLRKIRIFGLSSFEVILTLLALIIFLLSIYVYKKPSLNELIILSLTFIFFIFSFGIIAHYIFNVNTKLNYMLGLSKCKPNFNSLSGIFNC